MAAATRTPTLMPMSLDLLGPAPCDTDWLPLVGVELVVGNVEVDVDAGSTFVTSPFTIQTPCLASQQLTLSCPQQILLSMQKVTMAS